ncbi:hypothetical protein SKAU_G00118960 [Synaphobranchus kaupii]|uniref:HECT domain-containing protein n=1 Tax=Synaphobranchus kaupii TaxID=118154 RepID=A0A9Q1J2B1_SYNKA|nr:hypothetical protein SKAU_G00118960 [Synaphobranchus kaupii]
MLIKSTSAGTTFVDKESDLNFEELLIFITGADEVPALGFPIKPCIDFYQQEADNRHLPYASTCMMCLYLPRGVSEEKELHKLLSQAIRESWIWKGIGSYVVLILYV